ncbi:acyl-CoA dehydrogenase family protein [Ramlibacter albus]|uniref:Acyl-CoA dehydrogenase family protein n=1 Tax=Ramlibacter albus TaxID=2079448 RepID=A0A923S3Z3_9BURK|nr:acyl-CoA dehydrogenase family protein [Ramlibacter albus]MBC5767074.1 acyl-CoA dehydrogenase family protein [Ramlibacter albus]
MNFELDNDQVALQDSVARLLQSQASFEQRRKSVATESGWDVNLWPALAGLGVTALTLPESDGGFGQRPVALLPVLEALGHALAVQPFLATAVLASSAIARAGTDAQREAHLPSIAQGTRIVAFAHDERAARHDPLSIGTRARCVDGQWLLDGRKQNVLFGADAATLVVSARGENDTVMLFLVDPSQAPVRIAPTRLVDDTPAADITLAGARAERLAGDGLAALKATIDAGTAAACAEALGVAERAYELTTEYVQTRQQFGRAIGANQSLRHRIAEMRVSLDTLRSAAMIALLALEIDDETERARELSRAKMLASRHGTFITQQAIQLHGGIGMTVEYAAGHCLRRMTVLEMLFGDGASHAARLGAGIVASDDGRLATAA